MPEKALCEEEFLLFALEYYVNPQCTSLVEFYEDLNRIKYLKRLINRIDGSNSQKIRLILNHIIILTNVFGVLPANRILFFRMEPKYYRCLKTYLFFLEMLVPNIPEANIAMIEVDGELLEELRKI